MLRKGNSSSLKSLIQKSEELLKKELPSKLKVVVRVKPTTNIAEQVVISSISDKEIHINNFEQPTAVTFDAVFGPNTTQEDFFSKSGVKEMLDMAIDGFSVTVFAFGQTGSGKTFTITGPNSGKKLKYEDIGLVPRSLNYLFQKIDASKNTIKIQASYVEIYNENVLDLLNPCNVSLPIRWSPERGFFVEQLFVVNCTTLDDGLAVLEQGLRNRTTASHNVNDHSSRSHSILKIYIEAEKIDKPWLKRFGKISFVDLAGSERVKESKATGETLNEALNINKSLLTLGKCITSLSDSTNKKKHVPFRDSKLTKLLCDSLTGTGQALMVACISSLATNLPETIKTLRYATQAGTIKTHPMVNIDRRMEEILDMRKEISELKDENVKLKKLLENPAENLDKSENSEPDFHGAKSSNKTQKGNQKGISKEYQTDQKALRAERLEKLRQKISRNSERNAERIARSSIQSLPNIEKPQWVDHTVKKSKLPIPDSRININSKQLLGARQAGSLRISTPFPHNDMLQIKSEAQKYIY